MKVIGLTGGVGSGKSLAAQLLKEEFHAQLLISDELGHVAMEPGSTGYQKIIERFGEEVLSADGSIHREALAAVIFQDEVARKDLNGIIHPVVLEYIKNYIRERNHQKGIIILESAILFESGCDQFCEEIWYVRVSEETRKKRLAQNRGYSEEKSAAIMAKQLSEEEFLSRCQVVIENNGTKEELLEQIRQKKKEYSIPAVMIADDQEINRVILKTAFQEKYDVWEVEDGTKVIESLSTGKRPDILLLDMLMPVTDGMAVLQYMQEQCLFHEILVYLISADEEELEQALQKGFPVKGLVQKPFDIKEIQAIMQQED